MKVSLHTLNYSECQGETRERKTGGHDDRRTPSGTAGKTGFLVRDSDLVYYSTMRA